MTASEMTFRMLADVKDQEAKGRKKIPWNPYLQLNDRAQISRQAALQQMIDISYLADVDKDWAGVGGEGKKSEYLRRQRQQYHLTVAKALSWPWINTSQVGLLTGYSPQYIDWMRTHNKLVAVADSTAAVRGTFKPKALPHIAEAVAMLAAHAYCPPELLNLAVKAGQPAFVGHMLGFPTHRVSRWANRPRTEEGIRVEWAHSPSSATAR